MTALRDMSHDILAVESLRPDSYTANANGESVSLREADSATIVVTVGDLSGSSTTAGFKLQESDDGSSGWSDVDAADIIQTSPIGLSANTAYQFGYAGNKGYIRVSFITGNSTSANASAMVILGHLNRTYPGAVSA